MVQRHNTQDTPSDPSTAATGPRSHRDSLIAYAESIGVITCCTGIAWLLARYFRPGNLLMIYLLGIAVVATRLGRGPSVWAALLGVVTFDFFFVPPVHTFRTSDLEYFFAFGVILAVSLIICSRSERLRKETLATQEYERRMAAMREATRSVQVAQLRELAVGALAVTSTRSVDQALQVLSDTARRLIHTNVAMTVLLSEEDSSRASHAVSLSDTYIAWRDLIEGPGRLALYQLGSQADRPIRMKHEELKTHPAWQDLARMSGERPPLRGLLSAPLISSLGASLGFIHLSAKAVGDLSETDEAILVQLTQIASVTLERLRLYEDSEQRREGAERLYAMSRELAAIRDVDSLLQAGIRHISELFGGSVSAHRPNAAGTLEPAWCYPNTGALSALPPAELEVSHWSYLHRETAGAGTHVFPEATALHLPLVASRGVHGVLVLSQPRGARHLHKVLETFANQIALAVERALVVEEAHQAQLRMETERLRNSLLSSISHDLRTPLAAITGAAGSLLWRDERFDAETRHQLKETIYEEGKRLSRLVENLLSMTRLESGIQVKKDLQPMEEVIGTALSHMEPNLAGRPLTTHLPHDLPLVPLDEVLIEQVLINLLENALKYTPAGSSLEVRAFASPGLVTIEVADRGPGLQAGDEERIFEKFYRGRSQGIQGAGLGLAICRSVIQAHGGRIWAESRPDGGAVFQFTLPSEPVSEQVRIREG